jgi:hypothetical protein
VHNPANIFKLGLKLQSFLVDDPINGDLKMQQYMHPVMASSSAIWSYGSGANANTPYDFKTMTYPFSTTAEFFMKYPPNTTLTEMHKQEWKVKCVYSFK